MIRPLILASLCFAGLIAHAQTPIVIGNQQNVGGVYIDSEGVVRHKTTDTTADLATQRLRAKALTAPAKPGGPMVYVSLPRLFEQVRQLTEAKKELPDEIKYLSGMTQIKYVFLYPEEHDIVLAGPAEGIDASNKMQAVGKQTGRPLLQLDDLVVALRLTSGNHAPRPFGCSLDPRPDAIQKANDVMKEFASATRAKRMAAMKDALGPQQVTLFGAPADTRFAFVTLAADYKLKRLCLAVEPMPVPGVGPAMDSSRAASARFWFEANYAPLLVSSAGDAFEIRGPRLCLKAGALTFDERGATETAKTFAKNFTAKFPQLATVVPAFADLQNIADLGLVAALIQQDKLEKKAEVDFTWITGEAYKTAPIPTPKNAETLVNFTNGSIVAGGVSLNLAPLLEESAREKDPKDTINKNRTRPAKENWLLTKGD